jgi:hypothetical protein
MIEEQLQKLSTEEKIKLIREVYANDIDKYYQNCVWTLDEHEKRPGVNPFKKIPYDWSYIPELVHWFQNHSWILVWKSRQILATWTAMAYALWLAGFHQGKKVAIQSKKSDDADALIQRIKVIYDRLPNWKPKAEFSYCRVKFPELGSDIFGIPQGSEQARSYTYSCFISDEFGFQEKLQETFGAIKPIVDGGGQFIAITTPPREKNFAYTCKKNLDGLFKIFEVHYSRRPDRDEKWKTQAKIGVTEDDWNRENELQMVQSGVTRVLSDFNEKLHVNAGIIYNREQLLYRIWDFGYHRPFCGWFQIDQNDRVNVLDCLLGRDILIDKFADQVIAFTSTRFPGAVLQDYCDIAGTQVSDKSEKTSVQILNTKGIHPSYRKFNEEDGFNLIRRKISTLIGDKPAFQIHPKCQYLIDGALYGLVYGRDGKTILGDGQNEYGEDERGYFLHGWDSMRYGFGNIYTVQGQRTERNMKTSALVNAGPRRMKVGR